MSLGALLLGVLLGHASAAELTINAHVERNHVALNEQIVLKVHVMGPRSSLPEPELPSLPNFSVYSSGRNHSISFVNGRVSSSVTHTYVLVPRFVGKAVIGPITAGEGAQAVGTEPIEVTVERPGAGSAAGPTRTAPRGQRAPRRPPPAGRRSRPEIFVTAEVDKKRAFVNEQVTLTVRFHTAVNLLGNPQYVAPKTAGFLAEDLPPERHDNKTIEGRLYYISEIKTALFPAQGGRLTIGPATVRCQVQDDVRIDPFAADFFERFFSGSLAGARSLDLSSDPLTVEAVPLPKSGKPPGFSGAVGDFSISAAVDRNRAKVGEAVNLTVTVSGTGNIKAVGEPRLPAMTGFRAYETVSSLSLDKKRDVVKGSKVFRTILLPRVSGELTIPPVRFVYFDPARRAYTTASTLPITVRVEGAADETASTAALPGRSDRSVRRLARDIRYLKGGARRPWATEALEAVAAAGLVHAVPFLIFAWAQALYVIRLSEDSDPAGRRFRGAWREAMRRLKSAQAARASPGGESAGALAEVLSRFLADKLDLPPAGLSLRRVVELLPERAPGLPPQAVEELKRLWEELEERRFAPPAAAAGGQTAELIARLKAVLKTLEGRLRR